MRVKKWDFVKREYDDLDLKVDTTLVTNDMELMIQCINCLVRFEFGDCYTSKQYHTDVGFGYPVCEFCYQIELENEKEATSGINRKRLFPAE